MDPLPLDPFATGLAAGLAVAMPLGAIGVLLVDLSMRAPTRAGLAAGLGVATADLGYAIAAAWAGLAVAAWLEAHERAVALAAAAVLAVVALAGLRRYLRPAPGAAAGAALAPTPPRPRAAFARFLGLTAVNPLTAAIFAALVAGLPDVLGGGAAERGAFVLGVFVASLAWQSALVGAGAALGRLPAAVRVVTGVVSHALVLALAVRTALGA